VYTAPLILAVIFSFVIVLVVINRIGEIFKEKVRTQSNIKDDDFNDYDLRLEKLEERIANLETLVLEQERYRKFSNL
jgi:uncharacterized membrane protein